MGAPTFKDLVAADVSNVFLNLQEFAEIRLINGKQMSVVVDDNELLERDKATALGAQLTGTYKARRLIYVSKEEFGPRPAQDVILTMGTKEYRVKACTEEAGILAIELEAVRS